MHLGRGEKEVCISLGESRRCASRKERGGGVHLGRGEEEVCI